MTLSFTVIIVCAKEWWDKVLYVNSISLGHPGPAVLRGKSCRGPETGMGLYDRDYNDIQVFLAYLVYQS